jgi:hypothetical protein
MNLGIELTRTERQILAKAALSRAEALDKFALNRDYPLSTRAMSKVDANRWRVISFELDPATDVTSGPVESADV